ncbi:prepilin peptidase CpaA [Neorhizobium sp. R1-B]|uniref:A24 family peptidase n=1 Tax=Neorhizobium sp. R1-B TaxID=2485162 RepID=UPI0010D35907|nr:prepilin peptidase [Neorhizobium sp. R1-B]TDX77766.1 prepilin peptidase CpaA [Neorhizobium sp. R1-B]
MVSLMVAIFVLSVLPLGLAFAAISDLVTMTIPNQISAIILASFLILAPFSGLVWPEIGMSLVAGLVVFGVCFLLFALNVMGGGDAKLLTVSAVWYGWDDSLLTFLVAVGFVGGAVTLVILLLRSQANSVMAIGIPLPASLVTAKKIPYGIAIAIAGFLTFHQAPIYSMAIKAFY